MILTSKLSTHPCPPPEIQFQKFEMSVVEWSTFIRCQISKLCSGFLYPAGKYFPSSLINAKVIFSENLNGLPHHALHAGAPIRGQTFKFKLVNLKTNKLRVNFYVYGYT